MAVRGGTPGTPFFSCREGFRTVILEKRDETRAEIGPHVIRTPSGCKHWRGDGDIKARRTGIDEVVFTKTDVPVDVVVDNDEVTVWEAGRGREKLEW